MNTTAIAAANKWVDAARPIIVAYFKLDDMECELFQALDHGRDGKEARGYIREARESLFGMLDGIRDDFIADQLPKQPPQDAPDSAWEERDNFSDELQSDVISITEALNIVSREIAGVRLAA